MMLEEPTLYVVVPCRLERVPVNEVKVLEIQETIFGEDLLSYMCPICNRKHESVVMKS